jgi:hypothetical protein
MTIDDPVVLTRPWSVEFPWELHPDYGFYEYACHEGNTAVRNYIETSRFERANPIAPAAGGRGGAGVVAVHAVALGAVEREAVDRAAEPELAEAAASLHNSNQSGPDHPVLIFPNDLAPIPESLSCHDHGTSCWLPTHPHAVHRNSASSRQPFGAHLRSSVRNLHTSRTLCESGLLKSPAPIWSVRETSRRQTGRRSTPA